MSRGFDSRLPSEKLPIARRDGQSQLTGFKMFDYLRLGQRRLETPGMVLVD